VETGAVMTSHLLCSEVDVCYFSYFYLPSAETSLWRNAPPSWRGGVIRVFINNVEMAGLNAASYG